MADERRNWVGVWVECPDCGEWIYTSWAPEDVGDKLMGHGHCGVFRISRREAVLEESKHAFELERVRSGAGLPGIRQPGKYYGMSGRKTRRNAERRDPGDEGK